MTNKELLLLALNFLSANTDADCLELYEIDSKKLENLIEQIENNNVLISETHQ